jgi:hypothetical protein
MMAMFRDALWLIAFLFLLPLHGSPPGIIIDHSPASSGLYIGSPSIVILPVGKYLASHDFFGPTSNEFEKPKTVVFSSDNRGQTWQKIATLDGLFWAGLFVHHDAAYIMGTDKHHGRIVIRRSNDNGHTWTEPIDSAHGLLTSRSEYHTAPTPVIEHNGRLWRGFEDASGGNAWGMRYLAMMLSIPADADLLSASNWTFSNTITRNQNWLGGNFNAWLEGNAVLIPQKGVVNILRIDLPAFPEKAAIIGVSQNGKEESFDPDRDIIDFPGGAKKFTIRFDPDSNSYWALSSAKPADLKTQVKPASIRNTLVLLKSENLRDWKTRAVLLHHKDIKSHGFQYPDWQFDGDDLVAVVRTAFDDEEGGAHNAHDANYLTFHRFSGFRNLH